MTNMYVLFLSIFILSCGTITGGQNIIDKINKEFSEPIKNFTLSNLGDSCPYSIPQKVPNFFVKNSGMFLCITIFEAGIQISNKSVDKDFKVRVDEYFNKDKSTVLTQQVDNFCKSLADHSLNATNSDTKQWVDAFNRNIKNPNMCSKICIIDNQNNIDNACSVLNYLQEFISLHMSGKSVPIGSVIGTESNRSISSTLPQQNSKITTSVQIQNEHENSQPIAGIPKIKTNTVGQENVYDEPSNAHEQDTLNTGEKKDPILEMLKQNSDIKPLQSSDAKKLVTEAKLDGISKIEDQKVNRNDDLLIKKPIASPVETGRKTEKAPVEDDDDGKTRFATSKDSMEIEKSKLGPNDFFNDDSEIPPLDDGIGEKVRTNPATNILKSDDSIGYVGQQFDDSDESHFFSYIFVMSMFCFVLYIVFHNKQKILALALEGRRGKHHRRRPNTANYRKLDSNLEEAVTSN